MIVIFIQAFLFHRHCPPIVETEMPRKARGVLAFPINQIGSRSVPVVFTQKAIEIRDLSFFKPARGCDKKPRDNIIL